MNKEKFSNLLFIGIFGIFWLVTLVFSFFNTNDFNLVDNRVSAKFKMFNFSDFLSGDYQDNFEVAAGDQLPKYNYFELLYPKFTNYINYNSVINFGLDKNDEYVNLGNVYLYNNYLLYDSINDFSNFSDDIEKINYVSNNTDASIYVYYINGDTNYNFSNDKKVDVDEYLKKELTINDSNISSLNISNFSDYKKYFYKLDHHWNNVGTNRAYLDIADMMSFNDKLVIKDTVCINDKNFYGSKSKSIAMDDILKETLCVYDYGFPNFNITIDGEEASGYGSTIENLNSLETISYASVYGGDYAEIVFENTDASSDKNLLIYSNSYSNSINKLLASHYKNTYVIDGRHNSEFNMVNYINEKNIDDVLILSSKMLFYDDIVWGDF